ncbi:hypothetical protein ACQP2E_23660 [Actinoplanes sp. CA-015351]|uniref:hypothetical protein n=1 Tax=Actinoplanes sp. CA-015351 TaxID=3239897 RepID=UPI003D99655C
MNEEILTAFRCLRHRQLMVLGAPGSGKSGFALLLTLALLGTREAAGPVPLLLAISEWDPNEPVTAYVSRRLAEDYAAVLSPHGGPGLPQRNRAHQGRRRGTRAGDPGGGDPLPVVPGDDM